MRHVVFLGFIWLAIAGCDNPEKTQATADAAASARAEAGAPPAPVDAGAAEAAAFTMPPRPVPTSTPTVTQGMPQMLQMQAIQYMIAMESPRPDDANADPEYAAQIAAQLAPIAMSFDKGPDKGRVNRVEVIASGRKIDMKMSRGCEAQTPGRALARLGSPLTTLLVHGVLVVRCLDDHTQCLQSTRDENDVLCTTVPRRK
jgi:hypothetical protein